MLTLILLTTMAALSGVGAKFGYPKYVKFRDKKILKEQFNLRIALSDVEWKQLKKTIQEECKGYYLSDALVKEVLNQGYRFNCKQIYELRDIYLNWRVKDAKDHVDNLTYYLLSAKVDAEEKIFNLLNAPKHNNVPLLNKNSEIT